MSKRMKSNEPRNLLALFMGTPVSDHIPRGTTGDTTARKIGPVLVVSQDDTLPRVFKRLVGEGFLSAPVVEGKRYVGFVDMMDLVQKTKDLFWGDTQEAWTNFWEKEDRFHDCTVFDVMKTPNMYKRDPAPPISEDYSSFSALELMVRGQFHRLAVVAPGSANKLTNILTQSMIISWLRQNRPLLGTLRTMLVSDMCDELKLQCETICEDDSAINAFNKMANEKVSGLAVVDREGMLTSAISVRDLRTVGTDGEYFHRLFRSIKEFKQLAREEHPKLAPRTHYSKRVLPKSGRFVLPRQTFEDVILKMADGNIHRIFVCESSDRPKPTHAISQVDVLRMVLNHIVNEAGDTSMTGAAG